MEPSGAAIHTERKDTAVRTKGIRAHFKKRKPPRLLPSCVFAAVFSSASLSIAIAKPLQISKSVVYLVDIAAACGLTLAGWAIVSAWKRNSPISYVRQLAAKRDFSNQFISDLSFRTTAINHVCLVLNAVFAMMKAAMGISLHSTWFGILAGYYIILCIARFLLIRSERRLSLTTQQTQRAFHEWKAYQANGILLILTTLFLQGAVLHLVYTDQGYSYNGMLIYVVALYDFYSLTSSIIYMLRSAKKHTPSVQAIKALRLATSLVSLLSLQSAMFASFGSGTALSVQKRMNGLTGTAIYLILVVMGLFMFGKARRQLRHLNVDPPR